MPTRTISTAPTQALHDTPTKMPGLPKEQQNKISTTSPPAPHTTTRIQLITDHDHDANSAIPQNGEAQDEYTLSAYGDISLSEVMVPPAPSSPRPGYSPLQSRFPQPHLRLKVRRPPMPKRRVGCTHIPDPMPYTGGIDLNKYWPGSPRPIANNLPWLHHQPMAPLLPPNPTAPVSQTQGKLAKDGGSSLEKLVDELLPSFPSIRLSPPGSPSSQAFSLPETHEQRSETQQGLGHPQEANDATKLPQSPPAPAPRKEKPKSAAGRTRLPPRLPIPKWDM